MTRTTTLVAVSAALALLGLLGAGDAAFIALTVAYCAALALGIESER